MGTPHPSDHRNALSDSRSHDYFRYREQVEKAAAENASSDAARRAHQELAEEYAALLRRG